MSEIKLVGFEVKPSMEFIGDKWIATQRSLEDFTGFVPVNITLEQGDDLVVVQSTVMKSNLALHGVQDESDLVQLTTKDLKMTKVESIIEGTEFVPYGKDESVEAKSNFNRCKSVYFM